MKLTVLVENTAPEELSKEWGLSILVEHEGKKYLLDTGASGLFLQNARKLGAAISDVDYGVLSHAHFDHSNGMGTFFSENREAPFYLRKEAEENCYNRKHFFPVYIGIRKGMLKKYADRIKKADGDLEIAKGVWLIGHKTPDLAEKGKRENMCIKRGHKFYWDDFSHEQSVVFQTEGGLVIVNGCCHGGVDHIIKEIQATFPGEKIYAVIGGFHLFAWSETQVRQLCERLRTLEVEHIYTGHCTGKRAYDIIKEELGEKVDALSTGKVLEI